jgi:phage major head subunit gpT-like protein
MTETDFPNILANVASKTLVDGFDSAQETWDVWAARGVLRDFKPATIAGLSEFEGLGPIVNDTGYQYGNMLDAGETVSMATYGKIYAFTRRAIINDDLGGLAGAMATHGETVARKIGDVAYSVLTANATMRDGISLFHVDHKNMGTAAVVSDVSIGEAVAAMRLQYDLAGERNLNIRPQFFVAPVALEGMAEAFFRSERFDVSDSGSTRANIYGGNYFTRVYDPRLDEATSTAWYLAGAKGKTVKVFFLAGREKPYIETQQGWESDGIEFKVRIDVCAKAIDWRALFKNPGA